MRNEFWMVSMYTWSRTSTSVSVLADLRFTMNNEWRFIDMYSSNAYVMDIMCTTDVESGKTTRSIRGSYSRSGHFRIDSVHKLLQKLLFLESFSHWLVTRHSSLDKALTQQAFFFSSSSLSHTYPLFTITNHDGWSSTPWTSWHFY